jgi:hypothetical protein
MSSQSLFLGVVVWRGSRSGLPAASVLPLCRATEARLAWETPFTDVIRVASFPNNGHVSWITPLPAATKGTVWQFELWEQRTYEASNPKHDRFMIDGHTVTSAVEVLDIERLGGEREGRERLCARGVPLTLVPDATPYVRCHGNLWARIPFVRCPDSNGLCRVQPSALEKPLRFLEWGDGGNSLIDLEIEGHTRTFLAPGARPEGPPRLRDWADDATVLKRVLAKLRKWDRSFTDALAVLDQAAHRVAELLAAPSAAINEIDMERGRLERVNALLTGLQSQAQLVEVARNAIEHGPVADEIERQKQEIFDRVLDEARMHARQAIAEETTKVAELENRKANLQGEVGTLEDAISALRAQQQELLGRLDESLTSRLEEILTKPERLLAELAILRAAKRVLGEGGKRQEAPAIPPPNKPQLDAALCTDLSEFHQSLQSALLERDTPRSIARPVLSSLLAGLVPILHGARAREALEAFGHVCAAGDVHWFDVPPTYTSPADLLRAGLGRVVLEARNSDTLRLVVLEGANRAPAEAYLLPLLDCYGDAWNSRPGKLLKWQESNAEGMIRTESWPTNLLLGATLVEGPTTLEIPNAIWSRGSLVLTDDLEVGTELDILAKTHPARRAPGHETLLKVSRAIWEAWRKRASETDVRACAERWGTIARELALTRTGRDGFLSLYAAAVLCGAADEVAIGHAVAHVVWPLAALHREEASQVLAAAASVYPDLAGALGRLGALLRP